MQPFFQNDAIVLGILLVILAVIFKTAASNSPFWKKFYKYVPALLLAYFIPAIFHWPLGLISPEWYDLNGLREFLQQNYLHSLSDSANWKTLQQIIAENNIPENLLEPFKMKSQLYFVSSHYLLPASLILLTLSIDFKGIINLGPKALIMFATATFGIIIGGPIAIFISYSLFPGIIPISADELWHGLSTVAGSWIGGGANQTAMKEIFHVGDNLFATMIIVDVIVANIWMGFLLYGANISDTLDKKLKADNSAIKDLQKRIADFKADIEIIPSTTDVFVLLAVAFGGVAISHWGADSITPILEKSKEWLTEWGLNSLMSSFFWLIVFATTIGLLLSFTKAKKLEGVGASRWGSVFIYILVVTIGMKINMAELSKIWGLFLIGIIWMSVHVIILLVVAKLIKAPFFFVAVGSQANVGGAASAPIVASAFNPSLAPVGVLLAVLGYALGTYGALVAAKLMESVATQF